jgi:serine protease Do
MRRFLSALVIAATACAANAVPLPTSFQSQVYAARDRVLPALVHIQPVIKDYNTGELKKQAVIGSGVVFDAAGYVVTNYHVAGKAERIICTLGDREQVPAKYIGGDPPTDVAVIQLQLDKYKGKLAVAEFGNSDSVQVGQYVLAMGSPLALARTVSAGVISTKDRYFGADVRLPSGEPTGNYNLWIQTDAAINPGNSGGPLVDLNGRVIGINSRATMFANSLGFSIPINIVKEATKAILANGHVTRSWIGVTCQALQELESYFATEPNAGVLVASLDPGSPAELAGIQAGDLILSLDGNAVSGRFVEELPSFYKRISTYAPGSVLTLRVRRGDQESTVNVTTRQLGELQGEDSELTKWGFTARAITRNMQLENQLKDTVGVFVSGVKDVGPADNAGLRRGDVLIRIDTTSVTGLAQLMGLYATMSESVSGKLMVTFRRGTAMRFGVIDAARTKEGQ